MTGLARSLSRSLALALAAAVAGVGIFFVATPLLRHAERFDEDIRLASELGSRLTARIASRAHYVRQVEDLEAEMAASTGFFRGETDALAAAALQRRLGEVASSAGASLISVQSLPSAEESGFVRVALRADMAGSVEALSGLIYDLEAGDPYVFLDNLEVRRSSSSGSSDPPTAPVQLSVSIELAGYMALEAMQ